MSAVIWCPQESSYICHHTLLPQTSGTVHTGHWCQPWSCRCSFVPGARWSWTCPRVFQQESLKDRTGILCDTERTPCSCHGPQAFPSFTSMVRKVILRMDNPAVSWMRSLKAPTGQTARWLERVAEYDLEVVHPAGKTHGNADALFRRPCASCTRQEQINQDASRDEELESVTPSYKPCVTSTPKEQIGDTIDEEEPEDAAWTLPSPQPEQALQTMVEDELSWPEVTDDSTPHFQVTTRQQSAPIPDDLRHNQGWLQGWEMEKIRQSQVEDPIVGPFLLHKEEMKPKPTWMEVSAKCEDYKALWSQLGQTGSAWESTVPEVPGKQARVSPLTTHSSQRETEGFHPHSWPSNGWTSRFSQDSREGAAGLLLAYYADLHQKPLQTMWPLCS